MKRKTCILTFLFVIVILGYLYILFGHETPAALVGMLGIAACVRSIRIDDEK